ncbi:hypothetical protein [Phaeovulum sp.]|uniref:hypothetical protein n=1 Tax=Phaeovulum sp. TaxID=2934796 RepID=UPI0039E2D362
MKRITSAIAIAAIVLGGLTATPAAAWTKSEQQLLGVVAGALVLGTIIHEKNKKEDRREQANKIPSRNDWDDGYYNRYPDRHHDRYNKRQDRVLPENCVTKVKTRDGKREVLSARCLAREGKDRALPQACAFDIRADRSRKTVYGKRCLQDRGYRIGRR